jgi:hypothetical protein
MMSRNYTDDVQPLQKGIVENGCYDCCVIFGEVAEYDTDGIKRCFPCLKRFAAKAAKEKAFRAMRPATNETKGEDDEG